MTSPTLGPARLGFGAFGTSVGLALVTGALSMELAWFVPLVGALAALAVAGWASGHAAGGRAPRGPRGVGPAFVLLGLATVAYVDPPHAVAPARGLLLAFGLLPLWLVGRSREVHGERASLAG